MALSPIRVGFIVHDYHYHYICTSVRVHIIIIAANVLACFPGKLLRITHLDGQCAYPDYIDQTWVYNGKVT